MAGVAKVDIVCTAETVGHDPSEVVRVTVSVDNAEHDQAVIDGMMLIASGLPRVLEALCDQAIDVRVFADLTTLRVE